jgi:phosphate transport system substrate-binding protein
MRAILIVLVMAVALSSCHNSAKKSDSSSGEKITLTAAGSTFVQPFFSLIFKKYADSTGVQITYGSIGSGGGVRSLADKVVDFGATDGFLDDAKLAEMSAPVVHVPVVVGGVAIAYNLSGVDNLKLNSDLLEKIFLGEITKWDDPKIAANNPGVKFPSENIITVHRSDGSGTTEIFSDFLTKVGPKWAKQVGSGKSLNWPVGMGGKGNPGVVGTVSQTEGAIGYVGTEYAFAQKLKMAQVQNSSGAYILPTIASVSAAAKGNIPDDTRIMLTNSDNPEAYPIAGFSWAILYKEQNYGGRTYDQALTTVKLLNWVISPAAQAEAPGVNYVPIPADAVAKAQVILRSVTYDGKPLLK